MRAAYDVVVIGSGPNGLAAGIVAAERGRSVCVIEAQPYVGGGLHSAELTQPGFVHDVCSSVHPMGAASPFFQSLALAARGAEWVTPTAAAAHPLDDGSAAVLWSDLTRTCAELGVDAKAYDASIGWAARHWTSLEDQLFGPIGIPVHPIEFARFGLNALRSADSFARGTFATDRARALFAGCAAHAIVPFSYAGSAAVGIVLAAAAHVHGWPVVRGGSQRLADALADHFRSLGGEIVTGMPITRFEQLPAAGHFLFDTSPRAVASIVGERLPPGYREAALKYEHGPGVYKVDWALGGPIPWKAKDCALAATVHVGGTLEEIEMGELAPWRGECAEKPFVLVTQPTVVDPSRAPAGKHTAWGYCHVPNGSTVDMTARIEAQVERFAPGFRDLILARAVRTPRDLERGNANLVGGDIAGGVNTLANLLARPSWRHYGTPLANIHLCSSATPPGGGVHGMCGVHAAKRALGA